MGADDGELELVCGVDAWCRRRACLEVVSSKLSGGQAGLWRGLAASSPLYDMRMTQRCMTGKDLGSMFSTRGSVGISMNPLIDELDDDTMHYSNSII